MKYRIIFIWIHLICFFGFASLYLLRDNTTLNIFGMFWTLSYFLYYLMEEAEDADIQHHKTQGEKA